MVKEVYGKLILQAVVCFIIAYLITFFLGQSYDFSVYVNASIGLISGLTYFFSWRKGVFDFLILLLASISVFVALENSFDISFWYLAVITIIISFLFWYAHSRMNGKSKYAFLLLVLFAVVWIILGFNVLYRDDWILENVLTVPFVILILILHFWFKLSRISYTLIYIFMTLHIFGSHYTYSEVPFGFWMQNYFELSRNHYDRVVHFCFGLLMAYPVREVFVRIGESKGFWALYTPIEMVFGFSAIYEIAEWIIALVFGGDLGIAYLGSQGDIWDAQKDMVLAGIGSIIAMAVTSIVLFAYRGKEYYYELRDSLKIKGKGALGEEYIARIKRK